MAITSVPITPGRLNRNDCLIGSTEGGSTSSLATTASFSRIEEVGAGIKTGRLIKTQAVRNHGASSNAGLSVRYNYADSPWISEFGGEYRSNDANTTVSDNKQLPSGNYASNTFYINGRYVLSKGSRLTAWIGGGATWIQEVDLDSEDADGERSFSDSGSIGIQALAGVDYELSERLYISSEVRYSSQIGLELSEEGGAGRVSGIDYQPVTLGLGIGYRF